jgi:hypothetical protein
MHLWKPSQIRLLVLLAPALGWSLAWSGSASAMDYVTLRRDGQTVSVEGQVLVVAQDGGMLVQARDGVLWAVQPDQLVERTTDAVPFEPVSSEELAQRLLGELPPGFQEYSTANYVILYNTSRSYAEWCGSLFERLYKAFANFWSYKGFELSEPEFPLVAILFADKRSYVDFSRAEAGDAAETIIGYYSLRTNRMVMYDLSDLESLNRYGGGRYGSQIDEFLSRPEAPQTVATIVHEATHQIAFNRGLHARYSDCPLWFTEGVALYFETPDLRSSRGWRTVGRVNEVRLRQFKDYLKRRPPDSLATLLREDTRLKNTETAQDAYAEAWALTYFLIKRYPDQYVEYLKLLAAKQPLVWDDPKTRLEEFARAFGDDFQKLDKELVRYMARLR